MLSGQCRALPRNNDRPEPQAFEGPKAKRGKKESPQAQPEVIGYKTKNGFCV